MSELVQNSSSSMWLGQTRIFQILGLPVVLLFLLTSTLL